MSTFPSNSAEADENERLHAILTKLLRKGHFAPRKDVALQLLDIACGECREAETLIQVAQTLRGANHGAPLRFVGTDLRKREVEDAAQRFRSRPAATFEFIVENAAQLDRHQQLGQEFDLAFIRHQNFWLDGLQWKHIFEQGLTKLSDDGLLVITSYFDHEHKLAMAAVQEAGGELIVTERHQQSIQLACPGKSVDRHVALFRKQRRGDVRDRSNGPAGA